MLLYIFSGCGGDLTSSTGDIESPNYPQRYPHNAECIYTITVARGSTVTITFAGTDIELARQCQYDFLEVCILIYLFHSF